MGQENKEQKDKKRSRLYSYLQYSSLGLEMGLSVAIASGIGYWLDKKLGTEPWLFLFWFFCGLAAGFRSLFRLTKKYMKKEDNNGKSQQSD